MCTLGERLTVRSAGGGIDLQELRTAAHALAQKLDRVLAPQVRTTPELCSCSSKRNLCGGGVG